jgi:hypothetical protein
MSRFSLGVMLLQRLDVFGIILILIYFLYKKKVDKTLCRAPCTKLAVYGTSKFARATHVL